MVQLTAKAVHNWQCGNARFTWQNPSEFLNRSASMAFHRPCQHKWWNHVRHLRPHSIMLILKWNGRKKKNVKKKTDAKDFLGFAGFLLYRNFYHIPMVTKLHRSWKTLRSYIVQKWKAVLFSNMSEIRKTWRCTHLHQTLCISTRFDLTLLPSAHHWWSLLWRWPSTVRDLKSQHFRRSRGALRQEWVFSWAADVGWSGRTHHNLVFVFLM